MAKPDKTRAIDLLTEAISEIPDLMKLSRDSGEFVGWQRDTEVSIEHIFGDEGRQLEDFKRISYSPYFPGAMVVGPGVPDRTPKESDYRESFEKGLDRAKVILRSMIKDIEKTWEDANEKQSVPRLPTNGRKKKTRVFVVHGRDDDTRQAVARLIEKLDLKVVILEEQANRGRTVIDKFEQEAEKVGFAVVLLTPDDEGWLRGEDNEPLPRARQNVIFELGYFAGSLGRNRVCVLNKGDVEIPSDFYGVMYISFSDPDGWKLKLVKELQAAGFDVDANRIL